MSQHQSRLFRTSSFVASAMLVVALGCDPANDPQSNNGGQAGTSASASSSNPSLDAGRKQDTGTPGKTDTANATTPDAGVKSADSKDPGTDTAGATKNDAQTTPTDSAAPTDTRPRVDTAAGPDTTSAADISPGSDTQSSNPDSGGTTGSPGPQFQGRFDFSDTSTPGAAVFGWTASAIVARFQGTGIDVGLESDKQYAVIIDGSPTSTVIKASSGTKKFTLATGLSAGTHDLVLWQRSESNYSTDRFTGFTIKDGQMLAPPTRPDRRIEIYGDSITAGYGIEGKGPTCSYSPDNSNSYLAYGAVTARALNAELHSVAWSGIGMYRNYSDTTESATNMPAVYARTTPNGKDAAWKDAAPWDFSSWQPHAVVINLGTNDISTHGDPGAGYHDNYLKFVANLRQRHAQTFFVLAAGPMLDSGQLSIIKGHLQTIIKERASAGDTKMSYLEFPTQTADDGYGCDYHPSVATNAKMSALLQAELKRQLGW